MTSRNTQWLTLTAGVGHWDTSNGLSCCWTRCQSWLKPSTPGKHQPRKVIMQMVIQSLLISQVPCLCLSGMGKKQSFIQLLHFPDGTFRTKREIVTSPFWQKWIRMKNSFPLICIPPIHFWCKRKGAYVHAKSLRLCPTLCPRHGL